MSATPTQRSRLGRARFGGGSTLLITVSLALGLLVAAGLGAVVALTVGRLMPWSALVITMAFTFPVGAALGWAVLVDRRTLLGATDRTNESVESQWYQRAVVGGFHDLIIIFGLGAAAFSLTKATVNTGMVLIGLFLVAAIDVAIRYRVASREGR